MELILVFILGVIIVLACVIWITIAILRNCSVHFTAPILPAPKGTIRVACVGDSTTYGIFLWNRRFNCYPAKLQTLLGKSYAVRNFAANSSTALATGDHPYRAHKVFQLCANFFPAIVIIMLGTNDAKPENWTTPQAFRTDYRLLLSHYKALPSAPQIYAMTPPAVMKLRKKVGYNIDLQVLDELSQIVREESEKMDIPLIDIHSLTAGNPSLFIRLDGVHPNRKGAAYIAGLCYSQMVEHDKNGMAGKHSENID